MRRLPAWSVTGVRQVLLELQAAVAPVAAPDWFTSVSGLVRLAPVPLFQFVAATTPALSFAAIAVPVPTKLMLMMPAGVPAGFTVSPVVAVRLRVPSLPVTVSVVVPVGVVAVVDTVNVEEPEFVIAAGVNEKVVFAGCPASERATLPV
jgi:hypothetical protein